MGWDGDGDGVIGDRVGSVRFNFIFLVLSLCLCSPVSVMISYLLYI